MNKNPVYLDYNATAPIRPEVIERVSAVMAEVGNASSVHSFGQQARKHVEDARKSIADLVGSTPKQLVFTSGATESNNTALAPYAHKRVLVSSIEHPAVIEAAPHADLIPVNADGVIDVGAFEAMLNDGEPPAIVSVMMVNSETGAIQPVKEIAKLARAKGALVHTDAVQAVGRIAVNFEELDVDFLSLSAHKMAGPQGAGAFIFRKGLTFEKFMKGGTQERMQRGGTINVAGIAGFGVAADLAMQSFDHYTQLKSMHDAMEAQILEICPDALICAQNAPRIGNTSNIGLPGVPAQTQLMALDLAGIAVSSGSACSSGSFKPSHVLKAMGMDDENASNALRISSGWATTQSDFDRFVEAWKNMVERTKRSSSRA